MQCNQNAVQTPSLNALKPNKSIMMLHRQPPLQNRLLTIRIHIPLPRHRRLRRHIILGRLHIPRLKLVHLIVLSEQLILPTSLRSTTVLRYRVIHIPRSQRRGCGRRCKHAREDVSHETADGGHRAADDEEIAFHKAGLLVGACNEAYSDDVLTSIRPLGLRPRMDLCFLMLQVIGSI